MLPAGRVCGVSKWELDTPALLIDVDAMERNIARMAGYFSRVKAKLRPHVKSHKSPVIAHKQVEAGAIGVTCQKLGEAEVMAASGVKDILLSNEVAGDIKVRRLVNLARHCRLIATVDDLTAARAISNEATRRGVKVDVTMEVNMGRCGAQPGRPAVELARELMNCRGLRFRGIWEHGAGRVDDVTGFDERRRKHTEGLRPLIETRDMLEEAGIDVEIVSGGQTGTYNITGEYLGITDVQAGSYVFMDRAYGTFQGLEAFENSLTILTTVISKPTEERALLDVGLKSASQESGIDYSQRLLPEVKDIEGAELHFLSEEHGWLRLKNPSREIRVGDKLELIPSHCCTTVNLHDHYYVIRGDELEAIWDVAARGRFT